MKIGKKHAAENESKFLLIPEEIFPCKVPAKVILGLANVQHYLLFTDRQYQGGLSLEM